MVCWRILVQGDGHGEGKMVHAPSWLLYSLLDKLGGFTQQIRNLTAGQAGTWGSKHIWGKGFIGMMALNDNLVKDITENSDMVVVWGRRPRDDHLGLPWTVREPVALLLERDWPQAGLHQPRSPTTRLPSTPTSGSPSSPTPTLPSSWPSCNVWMTEGTFDQEYVKTHTVGFDKIKAYVLGEEDGREPKTPKWASPKCGVPVWTIKALARDWAKKTVTIGHYFGGGMARGPYPPSRPAWSASCWVCRAWASRASIRRR